MTLYVAGHFDEEQKKPWGITGIYDSKESAETQCKTYLDFVAPFELNLTTPMEEMTWPGCYYPKKDVA